MRGVGTGMGENTDKADSGENRKLIIGRGRSKCGIILNGRNRK